MFTAQFGADGTFALEGQGWPTFKGTWKAAEGHLELLTPGGAAGCDGVGRYRFQSDGTRLSLQVAQDDCTPRRMILDRSSWQPVGELEPTPVKEPMEPLAGARATRS